VPAAIPGAYTSGLVAAIVVAAILVVLRTFGTAPSPKPGCTPSDGWCSPQEPVTEGAGQPSQSGLHAATPPSSHQAGSR